MDQIKIGKFIAQCRKEKGLTQMQLAELLKCSQRVYSNYERGELDLPTKVLIKLADFYKVSTDYILNLTDNKNPPV